MLSWMDGDEVDLTARLEEMGLDFVKAAMERKPPGNYVFSPVVALLGVGPALFLRDDEHRRAELLEWLGLDSETTDENLAYALKAQAETFNPGRGIKMHSAVYHNDSFGRSEGYARGIQHVSTRMGLPVVKTQFPFPGAEEINRDVKKATDGMIRQVLDGASAGDVDVVYVNAVCSTRLWCWPFKLRDVHEWRMPGSVSSMTFMGHEGRYLYAETASYRYFVLPDSEGAMEIFLKRGYDDLPTDLTLDEIQRLRAKSEPQLMRVFMPKWDFQADTNLTDLMPEACVTALGRQADSVRILQTVRMVVSEKSVSPPMEPEEVGWRWPLVPLYIDHPFIFILRSNGVTEFVGYAYKMKDTWSCELI